MFTLSPCYARTDGSREPRRSHARQFTPEERAEHDAKRARRRKRKKKRGKITYNLHEPRDYARQQAARAARILNL